MIAATMILNRMSLSNSTLGEIHATLPQFVIVKDKISIQGIDLDNIIKKVISIFDNSTIDTTDGIKFTWDDRWVHLRKSNTEPIMRIYAEAPNHKQASELVARIKKIL